MQLGHFRDLNTTTVFPSPRKSSRVPFGTGKAMQDWGKGETDRLLTYPPEAYIELKELFLLLPGLYQKGLDPDQLPAGVRSFLSSANNAEINEVRRTTKSMESFTRKFYEYFDGFKVVKYLNHYVNYIGSKIPVNEAVIRLWSHFFDGEPIPKNTGNKYLLNNLRELDRSSSYIR